MGEAATGPSCAGTDPALGDIPRFQRPGGLPPPAAFAATRSAAAAAAAQRQRPPNDGGGGFVIPPPTTRRAPMGGGTPAGAGSIPPLAHSGAAAEQGKARGVPLATGTGTSTGGAPPSLCITGFPTVAVPTPVAAPPLHHVRLPEHRVPRGRLTLALCAVTGLPNHAAQERRVNACVRFELYYGLTPGEAAGGGGRPGSASHRHQQRPTSSTGARGSSVSWGVAKASTAVVKGQPISKIEFCSQSAGTSASGHGAVAARLPSTPSSSPLGLAAGPGSPTPTAATPHALPSPSALLLTRASSTSSFLGAATTTPAAAVITRAESVFLTVTDAARMLQAGNSASPTPLPWLVYTVVSPGLWGEEVLATGAIAVGSLFTPEARGAPQRVALPLTPHQRAGGPVPTSSASVAPSASAAQPQLILDACFEPLSPGVLVLTLREGRGLTNRAWAKQDPYVLVTGGGGARKARSCIIKRGGTDVSWAGEALYLWVGPECWGSPLDIAVYDHDATTGDDLVGRVLTDPVQWVKDGGLHEESLALGAPDGPAGTLTLSRRFYPAGQLTVKVCEGRGLSNGGDALGDQDPYAELALLSAYNPMRGATRVDPRGGAFPCWDQTFHFDVVDVSELKLTVRDHDTFTRDDTVGEVTIDLGSLYRYGVRDAWVPIKKTTSWGERQARGEIRVEAEFVGPSPDIEFPQLCLGVAAYDASERRRRPHPEWESADPELPAAPAIPTPLPSASTPSGAAAPATVLVVPTPAPSPPAAATSAGPRGGVGRDSAQPLQPATVPAAVAIPEGCLSEADAEAAFHAMDLGGKASLGAAEVKHLLVCLGELVTDEEVDCMIRMLDSRGDGRVRADEFKAFSMGLQAAAARTTSQGDVVAPRRLSGSAGAPLLPPLPGASRAQTRDAGLRNRPDGAAGAAGGGGGGPAGSSPLISAPRPTLQAPVIPVRDLHGNTLQVVDTAADPAARRQAMARAAELGAKERKRKACRAWVAAQSLRLHELQATFRRLLAAQASHATDSEALRLPYTDMCRAFGAARTDCGEALFSAFMTGVADEVMVDARELLLALSGFVGADRPSRVQFVFELYEDPAGSGSIPASALAEIVKAVHLEGGINVDSVRRKTQTILRAAGVQPAEAAASAGSGSHISLQQFKDCVARFSNLLLPEVC